MKTIYFLAALMLLGNAAKAQADSVIVSAFFGLDNALPFQINFLCPGAVGMDGMPVNFKYPIDAASLSETDFEVLDSLGNTHTPMCAVLAPANEIGENRTVLLIGEFGNADSNRPKEVRVIGDLFTLDQSAEESACSQVLNLIGASTNNVIALANGPSLFFAQKIEGSISECASQTIQVTWDGGVVPYISTDNETDLYQYYRGYTDSSGILVPHVPNSILDINDNDNYHQLCFATNEKIVKISMEANKVEDPNQDPNKYNEIDVSYCTKDTATSVEFLTSASDFSIFPNPATNQIEVITSTNFKGHFEVYDLLGNFLLSSIERKIPINELPIGAYLLLKKNSNGYSEALKFIRLVE